jgi:hypothetical protein
MEEHWFDTLNKAMAREKPRRSLLGAAIAAITSLGLLVLPDSGKGKKGNRGKNGKKRRKGNNKNKQNDRRKDNKKDRKKEKSPPPPDPAATCSGGICRNRWPSNSQDDTHNRNFCEFICEQCDGDDPREFCLIINNFADCCDEGLKCCTDEFGNNSCVNVLEDDRHCGVCGNRCSLARTCFGGTCECDPGLTECDGICRNTQVDENFCGGCDVPPCTGLWERCCDGVCADRQFDNAHCGPHSCNPCPPDNPQCCWGNCINPATQSCCRDADSASSAICGTPNAACCPIGFGPDAPIRCCSGTCCTHPDGAHGCCP